MPLTDVTVDTNVFLHADNPTEARQGDALAFLQALMSCGASLAIDEGFDVVESKNRSLIGAEYLEKLVPGTFPSSVLAHLALNGRLSSFPTRITPQQAKKLNQTVSNKRDRTFIRVTMNADGKVLVSHDYTDFPSAVRTTLGAAFSIRIIDAVVCSPIL